MTIEPGLVDALDITVIPLSFMIDGVIYTDGDLSLSDYMTKMEASDQLPKTSQPPVGLFAETYNQLTADGSEVISIHLSNILSGTVEAARQGAALSAGKVTVVDSDFIDQGLAFQVVLAAQMAQDGKSLDEILSAVSQMRDNTDLFCGVANLDNLVKGGRIGRVSGMIGGFLDIKVILQMKNDGLVQYMKGRGSKTFKKWLTEMTTHLTESGRKVKEIGISHAENLDFAKNLKENLQKFVEKPINILDTSTIIATHTGRGAWAVVIAYE